MENKKEIPFGIDEKPSFKAFTRSWMLMRKRKVKLWENARFILIDLPLNADTVKRILPLGMGLVKPPTATLFIVNYTQTLFTCPYMEAALLLHVRTPFGKGQHCCWMVVDDDTALIYGREFLAFPKKLADIPFEEKDNSIIAGVKRRGIALISIKAEKTSIEEKPLPVFNKKTFNIGGVGQWFMLNPVWLFKPNETIHEAYSAEASLTLNDSLYDPIKRFIAEYTNPITARFVAMDILGAPFILPVGIAGIPWFIKTYNMRYR